MPIPVSPKLALVDAAHSARPGEWQSLSDLVTGIVRTLEVKPEFECNGGTEKRQLPKAA